jgi:hypothetical protein
MEGFDEASINKAPFKSHTTIRHFSVIFSKKFKQFEPKQTQRAKTGQQC